MQLFFDRFNQVAAGPLSEETLVGLYRHPRPRPDEQEGVWLRTNFVSSLDGSVQGIDGRSGSINTPSDQYVFALHRAHADAVLVGAETARTEGYRAVDLAPWQRRVRASEGLSPCPTLVIITRSLGVDPGIRHLDAELGGSVLIITTEGKREVDLAPFRDAGIEVTQVGKEGVDLTRAMQSLSNRGLRRVLCEGGPRLHRDLLAADLVDEMSLTLAPVAVGGQGHRSTSGAGLSAAAGFVLDLVVYAEEDETLLTRYRRDR